MTQNDQQNASKSDALGYLSPNWREDIGGIDSTLVRCLIMAASEYYVYALGLLALEGLENHYKRVGMIDWRAPPRKFGWDFDKKEWRDEQELETVIIL